MLDTSRLVDHVIISPLLVGHVAQRLDRVLAARVNEQADLAIGVTDQAVSGVDLVLHCPGRLGADAAKPVLANDLVVSAASR